MTKTESTAQSHTETTDVSRRNLLKGGVAAAQLANLTPIQTVLA